ncbi:hypothetical protein ABDK56_11100 [Sphingomonas sp. ASV193]|uniref:hypothetical protein n=1 Tax=Sphingomonas sp. ASV193 TaxID=3144405 RepID=UPI0032E8D852
MKVSSRKSEDLVKRLREPRFWRDSQGKLNTAPHEAADYLTAFSSVYAEQAAQNDQLKWDLAVAIGCMRNAMSALVAGKTDAVAIETLNGASARAQKAILPE